MLPLKRALGSQSGGINTLFATHVVELVAVRRNPPPIGRAPTRTFLATNSVTILNSIAGKTALHVKLPTKAPKYNASAYNLITVWDIIMQDWRNVNLNSYNIKAAMPVTTEEEVMEFWQFFNDYLSKWSTRKKENFLNMP